MTAILTETARTLTTQLGEELKLRQGQKSRRRVVRELVRIDDTLTVIILSAWAWVRETLEGEGFEGRELAGHCRVLLDGIDQCLGGYEQLLALAEESDLTPEAAGLPGLEASLRALREARPKVAEVLDRATRPLPPIDEVKLAEARAALDRGEFATIDDDYLSRLRTSGDL